MRSDSANLNMCQKVVLSFENQSCFNNFKKYIHIRKAETIPCRMVALVFFFYLFLRKGKK